jgi:hypothetical protein
MAGSLGHSGKAPVALDHNPGGGASLSAVVRSERGVRLVGFARTKTVGAAGPAELYPPLTDPAKFGICDQSIAQDHRGVKRMTCPMLGFKALTRLRQRSSASHAYT